MTGPGRHDLIDGELWTMTPAQIPHGRFSTIIIYELESYVRKHGGGKVYSGELAYELDELGRTILCPDVSFVRSNRTPPNLMKSFFRGAPDLAVEVVSDSERAPEILTKVRRYLAAGTALVWCVYPERREVIVHHASEEPVTLRDADVLAGGDLLPHFVLPLPDLFEED
jgi:Uma2 family endonuclease